MFGLHTTGTASHMGKVAWLERFQTNKEGRVRRQCPSPQAKRPRSHLHWQRRYRGRALGQREQAEAGGQHKQRVAQPDDDLVRVKVRGRVRGRVRVRVRVRGRGRGSGRGRGRGRVRVRVRV